MKPPQCTPIHQGFSIGIKNIRMSKVVWMDFVECDFLLKQGLIKNIL